jgi:hypothetical protein
MCYSVGYSAFCLESQHCTPRGTVAANLRGLECIPPARSATNTTGKPRGSQCLAAFQAAAWELHSMCAGSGRHLPWKQPWKLPRHLRNKTTKNTGHARAMRAAWAPTREASLGKAHAGKLPASFPPTSCSVQGAVAASCGASASQAAIF